MVMIRIYKKIFARIMNLNLSLTDKQIFFATVIVGGFNLIVKFVTFFKELVVANIFGINDELDAFLIALTIPSSIIAVIAGSFNAALIPTYIQVRESEGGEAANKLLSNVLTISTILLAAISLLMFFLAPYLLPLLGSGFNVEKISLTKSFFIILLPIITISGIGTIIGAVLNAEQNFALVAIAPVLTPLFTIVLVSFGGRQYGAYTLALGTVLGMTIEAIILTIGLKRRKVSIKFKWYGLDTDTRIVIQQYIPTIAGSVLMSSTTLVDQSMAAMLGSGSVSALNYGNKIVAFIAGLGSTAIGTAVLPYFSKMIAKSDWKAIQKTLKTYLTLIILISMPLTLVLIFYSEPLVKLIFERGSFSSQDSILVGQIQANYLLQIPFYIMSILLVRLISSLKANNYLMWSAFISVIANVSLNYILMKRLGAAGIALATSLVYYFSFIYCAIVVKKLIPKE